MNCEKPKQPDAIAVGIKGGSALNWFVPSAGAILASTGIAKVWSTHGSVKLLAVADPIFGIPFRWLLLAVGVLELVIAGVCFFSRNKRLATLLVAWLATNFVVYRLGLLWVGYHKPCGCLGNITDALHISPQTADSAIRIVLGYLLVGSYATLFWLWRQSRKTPSTPPSVGPAPPTA